MANMPKSDWFRVGPVVLSYVDSLFVPQTNDSGKESYGANMIFNDDILNIIAPVVEQIGRQAFPNEWDIPNKCKRPFHYLAEKKSYEDQKASLAPGYHYYCAISTLYPPSMYDMGSQEKMQANNVNPQNGAKTYYGGVWANLSVNVYSWNYPKGGQGVSIGLQAASKIGDGPMLIEVGAVDAQQLFGDMPTTLPPGAPPPNFQAAQPAAAPAPGMQPGFPGQPGAAPVQGQPQYPAPGAPAPGFQGQPAAQPAAPAQGQPQYPGAPVQGQPGAAPVQGQPAPGFQGQYPAPGAPGAPATAVPGTTTAPGYPAPGAPAQGQPGAQGYPTPGAPSQTMAPATGPEPAPPLGQPAAPAAGQPQADWMGGQHPVTGQGIPPIQGQ